MTDGDSRRRGPRRAPHRLEVAVVHGRTAGAAGLAAWLRDIAPASARGGVTVALVSDARIRSLNGEYRRKDAVTDVLSFPWGRESLHFSPQPGVAKNVMTPDPNYLGDVVIATGVARRQAREVGHSFQTELRLLALHGLLHLLGYDHESDRGEMLRLERRLRRQGGLCERLIERGGRGPR